MVAVAHSLLVIAYHVIARREPYRELGADGRTVRTVEAPLTAEQRAQRAAQEAQRQADEVILREKQRLDQALLNTYGSEKDIEMMRARALDEVQKSILAAEGKIAEMRVKRKNFENEAEFYKKKPLPPEVQKGLRDADATVRATCADAAARQGREHRHPGDPVAGPRRDRRQIRRRPPPLPRSLAPRRRAALSVYGKLSRACCAAIH